jgi:hypothetical protein
MIEENNAVCAKLMALPPTTLDENQRREFLKEIFMGRPSEFCQFMGYMEVELSTIKLRRDDAVSIMSDIAFAALSIGRDDGRADAIKTYAGPEFQFLLNDRRKTA